MQKCFIFKCQVSSNFNFDNERTKFQEKGESYQGEKITFSKLNVQTITYVKKEVWQLPQV